MKKILCSLLSILAISICNAKNINLIPNYLIKLTVSDKFAKSNLFVKFCPYYQADDTLCGALFQYPAEQNKEYLLVGKSITVNVITQWDINNNNDNVTFYQLNDTTVNYTIVNKNNNFSGECYLDPNKQAEIDLKYIENNIYFNMENGAAPCQYPAAK